MSEHEPITEQWQLAVRGDLKLILSGQKHIADVWSYDVGKEQGLVNARLISAAPELLDALSVAERWISSVPHGENCFVSRRYEGDPGNRCHCGKDAVLDFIGAAIAKARGE